MFSPRKDPDSGGTMTLASPKSLSSLLALPRSLSSIVISLGGLALFLVVASRLLISYPIGSAVHERVHELLIGVDHSRGPPIVSPFDPTGNSGSSRHSEASRIGERGLTIENPASRSGSSDGAAAVRSASAGGIGEEAQTVKSPISQSGTEDAEIARSSSPSFSNDSSKTVSSEEFGNAAISSSNPTVMVPVPPQVSSDRKADSRSCDLYRGKWVYDSDGPLYTNNTCPIITQMQNCQGNGRPDKNYENWRWKPNQCNLPHFDAKKILELMRGKTLAFVGDSVARNQMESMLCILWQVEAPKNRGTRKMHRWYFKSTSTTIVRLWSSWLVHLTNEPIQFAPEGIVKLHLDLPDETFMEFLPRFDVVVLSSGHWFAKQSVYILNDTIVGWQLWKPPEEASQQPLIGSGEAYGISVETALTAIATHPNYSGLTIVRSFSPDHYEGGAWNTGGSCTGKDQPATEVVRNGFTDSMHEKQVRGFESVVAAKKAGNGSKLRLLDITEMFGYRHDGHPGPYRNLDPNKVTKRGPDGKPPPQDCLHWCMPGPVDTWNELVLEIIRREFEGAAAA